jgi:hypothetical protein
MLPRLSLHDGQNSVQKLPWAKWFREMRLETGVFGALTIRVLYQRGHRDNGYISSIARIERSNVVEQVKSVTPRHDEVTQDQIWMMSFDRFQSFESVGRRDDISAFLAQKCADESPSISMIFDYNDCQIG